MSWWKAYAGHGEFIEILSRYHGVEDFEAAIPTDLKLNINKALVREGSVWLSYFEQYGSWPTVSSIIKARGGNRRCERLYNVDGLISEDNYGEHY